MVAALCGHSAGRGRGGGSSAWCGQSRPPSPPPPTAVSRCPRGVADGRSPPPVTRSRAPVPLSRCPGAVPIRPWIRCTDSFLGLTQLRGHGSGGRSGCDGALHGDRGSAAATGTGGGGTHRALTGGRGCTARPRRGDGSRAGGGPAGSRRLRLPWRVRCCRRCRGTVAGRGRMGGGQREGTAGGAGRGGGGSSRGDARCRGHGDGPGERCPAPLPVPISIQRDDARCRPRGRCSGTDAVSRG